MDIGIFKDKESFKKEWLQYTKDNTGIEDSKYLSDEFDKFYNNANVNIYNSFLGTDRQYDSMTLINDILSKYIIVENGVLFLKHDIQLAACVKTYAVLKKLRASYKNSMKKAIGNNNTIEANFYNLMQGNTKEALNTFYGIMINIFSKYYNYDVASATTSRGRSTVSMNGLTIEANFGSYRPYVIDAVLHFINNAKKKDISKYSDRLANPTDDTLLDHLLKYHLENYYAIDILKKEISKLTVEERKAVYYTSNYDAIIKLPFVKALILKILKHHNDNYYKIHDLGTNTDSIKQYKKIIYIDPMEPPIDLKDDIEEYINVVRDLLTGFYYYEGYKNEYGEDQTSTQEIFKSITRDRIIITDTDSLIITLQEDMKKIKEYEEYNESVNNIDSKMLDYILGSFIISAISTVITDGLGRYTAQSLITESYRSIIAYKQEFYFSTLQTTKGAKNYLGIINIQEGMFLPNESIDLKGLSLKKKNFNKRLANMARHIAINMIAKNKTPNIRDILNEIDSCREEIPKLFKGPKNIEMFTVSKLKKNRDDMMANEFLEYRFKAVKLYEELYKDEIPIPGSFLITNIDLKDRVEDIKRLYPDKYEILEKISLERSIYGTIASLKRNVLKYNDTESSVVEEESPFIKEIIENVRAKKTNKEIKDYIKEMRNYAKDSTLITDIDRLCVEKFIAKIVDIDDINKIALPLEAETVDPFITEFININDITVFENLIAVIVQGLGLEIIRNNKGHQIIHNIVSYY